MLARTGAPRGSVYHYFPRGRTELIEHAIDRSRRWMQDQIASIRAEAPADVVTGYIGVWRRVVEGTDFHAGCAATGAVTGGHEPGVLSRAEAALTEASDALAALFQQAGLAPAEAAQRATLPVCAAEGAVILARARRSVEPLTLIAEQLGGSRSEPRSEAASARPGERASQSG